MERIRCDKELKETCKYNLGAMGCHYSVHHEYWPKRDYKTPTEKAFRELDTNKVRVCRLIHDNIHLIDQPPEKPTHDEMAQAINESRQYVPQMGNQES